MENEAEAERGHEASHDRGPYQAGPRLVADMAMSEHPSVRNAACHESGPDRRPDSSGPELCAQLDQGRLFGDPCWPTGLQRAGQRSACRRVRRERGLGVYGARQRHHSDKASEIAERNRRSNEHVRHLASAVPRNLAPVVGLFLESYGLPRTLLSPLNHKSVPQGPGADLAAQSAPQLFTRSGQGALAAARTSATSSTYRRLGASAPAGSYRVHARGEPRAPRPARSQAADAQRRSSAPSS
jgi:hypothetical protein